MLEQVFAEHWPGTSTAWRLEREVDLIPLPGSVMVPDFRLVHPDGRSCLLEIVGYWRPEYLRKKCAQVCRAGWEDLLLAISERLNLERAGVRRADMPARVVWFQDRVLPRAVLDVLEGQGDTPRGCETGEKAVWDSRASREHVLSTAGRGRERRPGAPSLLLRRCGTRWACSAG
jgi:hypothetical protein